MISTSYVLAHGLHFEAGDGKPTLEDAMLYQMLNAAGVGLLILILMASGAFWAYIGIQLFF